jgi:hypothetical protein
MNQSKLTLSINLLFVSALALLTGCASYEYKPTVYPLAQDRIPAFQLNGSISLENVQTSTELQESSNSGVSHSYTYQQVTEGFNTQFNVEVEKHAKKSGASVQKTIKTSINYFICETSGLNTWVYRCEIKGSLTTGDGATLNMDYKHGAPVTAGIQAGFDSMIAIAVENALENQKVLAYLAK